MVTYKDYLEKIDVISEEDFNNVIALFPEVDNIDDVWADDDIDELCKILCNSYLSEYANAYCEFANFNQKTLSIYDVQSFDDLENIVKDLSNWTISNYDELVESIKYEEDSKDKEYWISEIRELSTKIIKEIFDKYVDKE